MTGPSVRELTARGRGAIRVLEVSGAGALERVAALAPAGRLAPGRFAVVGLHDRGGAPLDEALVVVDGPERVELHLHGAPALVRRVVAELAAAPAPDASASIEACAERRLAVAAGEAAARMLLDQARGALRAAFEELVASPPERARQLARELARRGAVARHLVSPPRVVLAGPVNAGKSTLFNALVGRERALVHAAPGTTRDPVEERVLLGEYAVDLVDTAGSRELPDGDAAARVERAGQALAADLASDADLVLLLVPPGVPAPHGAERVRVVRSQVDRTAGEAVPGFPGLSAREDPHGARRTVEDVFHAALGLPRAPWAAGRGVPFEPEWTATLARAEPPELAREVRAWLAAD